MSIFNNLFGKKTPVIRQFPAEENKGSVRIENDHIIIEEKNPEYNTIIDVAELKYAFIVIDQHQRPFLYLNNTDLRHLPLSYTGFKVVYELLAEKLGFNDDLFFEGLQKKGPYKAEIWRKRNIKNYKILVESVHQDYTEGFEIQSPEKEFISWDITLDELKESKNFHTNSDENQVRTGDFKYPVRLGNILFDNLGIYFHNRDTNATISGINFPCYNEVSNDGSYKELKSQFIKDLDKGRNDDDTQSTYYRNTVQHICFTLSYYYTSEYNYDGGYTNLSIDNYRDYPILLENKDYEAKMQVDHVILLDAAIRTPFNYKVNAAIKRRPASLHPSYANKTVIWKDLLNDKIGFTDQSYAQIFDLKTIESFSIQNVLAAKGGAESYLNINFNDERRTLIILNADGHMLNALSVQLAEIFGKTAFFEPEYVNI